MKSGDSVESVDESYAAFFLLSSEVMCILDSRLHFVSTNPAFEKAIGYSANSAGYKVFQDFVHPEDIELATSTIQTAVTEKRPSTFACRFQCANDENRWLLWRIYPQEADIIYAFAKDITPFQQVEDLENARFVYAEALLDTMLAVNSSLALDLVLERILSNVGRVVAHDHANIMLVEDDSAYIADYQNRTVNQAFDKVAPSLRFPVEENFYLGRMVETNQPVIVYDIANDPNWQVVPRFHVEGSYLGSPITVEDTVIGFLNVINLKKNFYTSIHARHLLAFANQAGIAIKNAQLYEQAKFAAALEERQRLARELHDSVSQSLFAAHSLATLIPRVHLQKPEKTLEYAATISQRIKGALDQMRVILIELYPDAITHTELGVLLKQLCAAHTESTDVAVQFSCADHILLDQEAQIVYYRITQEALHNIEKHADASQVVIKLQRDGDTITLLVKDDGCGFDLNAIPHHHFGVHNMIDRAESIGAALHVMSESGKGTQIILEGQFS